jgi:uncharacterized protein (UPF0332 family)
MKNDEILHLIKYRLKQAQVALDDAKFLIDGKRSPQSIVNRSFYAMFYAALALLQKIGKVPTKHAGVISLFDTEFALRGTFAKELSKDFHKAFELRQVSDYRVIEELSPEKAEDTWKKAERFVHTVKKYLLESSATQEE